MIPDRGPAGRVRGVRAPLSGGPAHVVHLELLARRRTTRGVRSDALKRREERLALEALIGVLRLPDIDDPHGLALARSGVQDQAVRLLGDLSVQTVVLLSRDRQLADESPRHACSSHSLARTGATVAPARAPRRPARSVTAAAGGSAGRFCRPR